MGIESIKLDADQGMQRAIEALEVSLAKLRTGRAHPSFLAQLRVAQYNQEVPLNHVANISTIDARTLLVTPWDKTLIPVIEKSIRKSDLGLNPVTVGNAMRVPLPALTEENRRELAKLVGKEVEDTCISIRKYRQEANTKLKKLLKEKSITEDEERRAQDTIQKITDLAIERGKKVANAKEKELMQV